MAHGFSGESNRALRNAGQKGGLVTSLAQTKNLIPEILPAAPPFAEVHVGPQSVTVTVSVPQLAPDDTEVALTRHSIRIKSRRDPAALHIVVPLPVAVEPERYVLRHVHDVLDFVIQRPSA